ncbi:RNA polymerase III subunit [Heterostelium album PN500]|uniref:RNA polymerase III subunit n=1 Tax=Heterostelium pallidum (strain ATCC 26659 / Pp 5 / PN500) TaxID=670386 RepID=D3B6V9_HETP5|nr:RNA polymerase III subunit [Heterostelium album PN500]EFA82502.1 RNA polymerase III subunit [Heterostelium album PN500]|eukprot:XP_020434619.1 RNA polymerase III subunit [Heterostelium album PN500]
MFHLITIEDKVRIPPNQFNNEIQTIEDEIEKKYSNKVVIDGGLFIALYDILGTGDAYVYSGDGGSHLLVRCRLVVFKPFVGEILEGFIKKSTRDYMQLSLGFFDDIQVLALDLPTQSFYHDEEKLWYWDWNDNQLFFEDRGRVRFKIDTVEWNDAVSQPAPRPKSATPVNQMDASTLQEHNKRIKEEEEYLKNQKSPMVLKVSMRESGLGMVSWWTQAEGGEAADDDEQPPEDENNNDDDDLNGSHDNNENENENEEELDEDLTEDE